MKQTTEYYAGYDCVKLENDSLALWSTQDVGPRIIALTLQGGENLLAVLPQAFEMLPDGRIYHFRGGHRLWHAPEDPVRTYVPDDTAVKVTAVSRGITLTQSVETATGIEKQITITLPDETAQVVIDHTLLNRGPWPVELAPWAITQLKPGGFAILPQPDGDTGLLPNRRLAFWPYARLDSPNLQWNGRYVFVHAAMQNEKFKLGWANRDGWLGYWVDDTLFIKETAYQPDADYYDFGSSSECYCDDRCLELETLGPRTTLAPGKSITHREVWRIFADVKLAAEETAVTEQLTHLGILPGNHGVKRET